MKLFEQSAWGFNFLCKNAFPVKNTLRNKGRMVATSASHFPSMSRDKLYVILFAMWFYEYI